MEMRPPAVTLETSDRDHTPIGGLSATPCSPLPTLAAPLIDAITAAGLSPEDWHLVSGLAADRAMVCSRCGSWGSMAPDCYMCGAPGTGQEAVDRAVPTITLPDSSRDWRRVRPLPPGTLDCLDCGMLLAEDAAWCPHAGPEPGSPEWRCCICGRPASECELCQDDADDA